jgi:threonine synthase
MRREIIYAVSERRKMSYLWWCNQCKSIQPKTLNVEWQQHCEKCASPLELQIKCGNSWKEVTADLPGIWRYLPLLPVAVKSAERLMDYTQPEVVPPVRCEKMAEALNIQDLFLLNCTSGPSGTFKDTEAAIMIGKCLDWELGEQSFAWHSTANTARAYREYALKANIMSYSFFPLECLYKWRGTTKAQLGKLLAYDGPFQELAAIAKKWSSEIKCQYLAPLVWKLEGKSCLAYTIMEFVPTVSYIVQTVAGGYGPLGIDRGFRRLSTLGLITEQRPKFKLFQISGADTISQLMPLNREINSTDLLLPKNAFEPTLQSTNPLATFNILREVLIHSKSDIQSVTPAEVEDHAQFFTQAPFISWAGLMRNARLGELPEDAKIILIITGSPTRNGELPELDEVISRVS